MIKMIPRVSLVSVGIFDFAEMRGFSSSGLYLREIAQRMHSSVSRYFVNGVRIREKNFSVLRLLQNMPAKTPPFSDGNLSSQVQQQIGKDFRGGVPVEAFARTMIQLFCKLGQSLCRKRNLIGVFRNVLPQQAVDLLV